MHHIQVYPYIRYLWSDLLSQPWMTLITNIAPTHTTPCRRLFVTLTYSFFTLLFFSSLLQAQPIKQPLAKQGVLDLRQIDFTRQAIDLRGEWKWYWNELRTPTDPESTFEYTTFPQLWASSNWKKEPLSNQGYATYALTVLLPNRSVPLMLELPDQYTSYRLFVNGSEVAHNGTPATTSFATTPYWSTQLVQVPATADTLKLLLQISNFQHAKGGSAKAIRIGEATRLQTELSTSRAQALFLGGAVFMTGLFFLGLFSFSRTDRPMLYFGLFCLIYTYRIIGTDYYALHTLFPNLAWSTTIRLEYSSLYLAIAIFLVYTQSLYPQDTHRQIITLMAWVCMVFAATVVVLPPILFTQFMNPFLALMVAYIGYAFYVYWIAVRQNRPGALYSLISTGILLVIFSLILGEYFGLATPIKIALFLGYLGFFFFQSLVLSYRFAFALNEARLTEKQFLANMSHEIRTPLNAILGFSSLLETTPLTDEQKEFTSYIGTAGKNLLTIVNDILDIAKIESGMLPLETIPFSVQSLVDSIRTMLQSAASDKKLRLTADIDPTIPPVLLGDPTRLTQILLNLLSNAIKFTKQGSVLIRVEKTKSTNKTVYVRFIVQDTGIGIDTEALPYIFERFRQANDSTTRQYGGTGLGLSIVKSLVQLQGGWVTVSSTPGQGSSFTVEIPYRIAPSSAEQLINKHKSPWDKPGHSLKILVAEDNLMNQKLALGVLNRLGHVAHIAENGQQAVDRLRHESFDLVLMDIQMPIMDGYTATHQIRNTLRSQIPIIAMTAHALASEREQCLQAGMNDFLPKPFQPSELQQLILKYVPSSTVDNKIPAPVIPAKSRKETFSIEPLLNSVGGDMEFALELVELFLEQTPLHLTQLRQALAANDPVEIGKIIHTQKAAIKMFGLEDIVQQIQHLETLIRAATPLSDFVPLVTKLIDSLDAELPAIQSFADKASKNPPSAE